MLIPMALTASAIVRLPGRLVEQPYASREQRQDGRLYVDCTRRLTAGRM
jgi:hypothetical protein